MSYDSKKVLMNDLQKVLSDVVTANQLVSIMDDFSVELSHYDVERTMDEGVGLEFDEMLETYLSAKLIEGCAQTTVNHYRYVITCFKNAAAIPIRSMTVFTLRNYLAKEKERGLSDRTLEGYRQVFSAFFNWIYNEGLLNRNPCGNLAPIKYQKKVLLPYSSVELEYLKESCECIRDRAIFQFLLSTGCRISEMCALNRNDVNFQTLECKVLGKGNKERIIYMDDVAALYLKRYFAERKDDSVALFAGRGTKRLTPGGVQAMMRKTGKKAEIMKVHPHRCRRTLATNLIARGMDIQDVKTILGHENIDTTMTYVYIDKHTVKNAYRKYA